MPKLVRDLIPDIMRAQGEAPKVRTLHDDEEYMTALREKLVEEVGEYREEWSLEELVDVLEVVEALVAHTRKSTGSKFDYARARKLSSRGGFSARQYLLE